MKPTRRQAQLTHSRKSWDRCANTVHPFSGTARHADIQRKLEQFKDSSRQNAAQRGKAASTITSLKAANAKIDVAFADLPKLRAERDRLAADLDTLKQERDGLRSMPHARPVRGKKGQPGRWQLLLPHWDVECGDYELPVLDVHVLRKSRKDRGARPGGVEFHVLLQLLMLKIPAVFKVAFERVGDLVALMLERLRICKLSRCAPQPH